MYKNLLTILVALLLCGLGATRAWAEDDPHTHDGDAVASVSDGTTTTPYSEFSEALAAWVDGSTLKLLKDGQITSTISVSGTKTLDLNGCGIKQTGSARIFAIQNNGDLTIDDSNPTKKHYFEVTDGLATGVNDESGTYEFAGGYITGGSAYSGGAIQMNSAGRLTMNGGTVLGNKADDTSGAIDGAGNTTATVTLNGGTCLMYNKAKMGGAMYAGCNITFNGVVIKNNYASDRYGAVEANMTGKFTIAGKTVIKDNTQGSNRISNLSIDAEKGKIIYLDNMTEGADIGIYSNGPYQGIIHNQGFTTTNGGNYFNYFHVDESRFDEFVLGITTDNELKLSYAVAKVTTSGGVTTKYATLEEALAVWVEGSTLTLLKDVETASAISTPTGNCTLDLNGYGLKMTGSNCVIYVGASSNLVMKDSNPNRSTHYYSAAISSGPGSVTDTQDASHPYSFTGGYITGGIGYRYTASGGTVWREGGAVYTLGTFTMNGGTLVGNYVREESCIAIVDGGSVCVGGGTFTLNDGATILAGQTSNGAGGVKVEPNSKFIMAGGLIKHCYGSYGAAVRSQHSNGSGDFIMTGGTITENTASGIWGVVSCEGNCTVTITGGSVINNKGGGVRNAGFNGGKVTIGGDLVIKDNAVSETDDTPCNLYILEDRVISVSESLGADVNIGVTMRTPGVFTNSENVELNDLSKFFSEDKTYLVRKTAEGQLKLGVPPVATVTADGTTTEYSTLAAAVAAWVDGSTLTLLKDVETESALTIASGTTKTFELNNHSLKLTATTGSLFVVRGDLTLQDNSTEKTKHYYTLSATENAAATLSDTETECSFEGGYITSAGNGTKSEGNSNYMCGANVFVASTGHFTLKSGTIFGGGLSGAYTNGGGVYVDGLSRTDVSKQGLFTMDGGTVCGCYCPNSGGGLGAGIGDGSDCYGRIVVNDGTIKDNISRWGSGIITDNGYLEFHGGTITGNIATSTDGGAAIYGAGYSTYVITGGRITGNKGPASDYGAVVIKQGFDEIGTELLLSGNPYIAGNYSGDVERNLTVQDASTFVTIDGELTNETPIGITLVGDARVFTNSTNTDLNVVDKFVSDDDNYTVRKTAEGQLKLVTAPEAMITADGVTTEYETLGEAISAWVDGSTLTLLKDVETTGTIEVPSGTLTFDLNGHGVLNTGTGSVISVPAGTTLNVDDSGDAEHYITLNGYKATAVSKTGTETKPVEGTGVVKVKGGYIAGGKTAGLHVAGTLNMTGGTVIGNYHTGMGGGMILTANGNVTLAGNSQVIYNRADGWGGAMQEDGTLTVKDHAKVMYNYGVSGIHFHGVALNLAGSPMICDNVVEKTGRGIRVENPLSIVGPLTGAKISVNLNNFGDNTQSREGQLTLESEFVDANTAAQFVCENDAESGATIVRRGQELWITAGYSVYYLANGGEGSTLDENNPYEKNAAATILANAFTAPEGSVFVGWNTEADGTGTAYEVGASYEVVGNLRLYAQWKLTPRTLTVESNSSEMGAVEVEGITANADGTYTVLYGTEVTIKATAAAEHHLESWSNGAEVTADGTLVVVVKSDTSIVANFAADRIAITPTVTIEGWRYGETPKKPTVTGNDGDGEVTYVYARKGSDDFTDEVPTEAGDYVVKVLIGQTDEYAVGETTAEFTISKADIKTLTVSLEGWKYGETPKAPVVTGNEGEGDVTYLYAPKGSDKFSETVPTEAGEYVVKAIVAESANYGAGEATTEFTIGKSGLTAATVSLEGWMYGETPKTPVVTGNGGNGAVTYMYAPKGSEEFSETVPTNAGEYVVKAIIAETANYEAGEATSEFTIAKTTITAATVSLEGWTYGEPSKTPTVTGNTEDGKVTYVYARKGSDDFSDKVPTEAGDYVVKAIIGETANFAEIEITSEFTIAKAKPVVILAGWTYGSEPSKPSVSSSDEGGKVTYLYARKDSEEFTETVPTNAGEYVVKAIIGETANYTETIETAEFVIERAVLTVSGVEVVTAKLFDNTTEAEVIKQGTLVNLQGSDELTFSATASYDDITVGGGKVITLTYALVGPEELVGNYRFGSETVVYTTDGYIAEPIVLNTAHQASGANTEMRNGFEINLYGYCNGSTYSLQYYLGSGDPDQYKVEFEDERFTDVDWTNLETAGVEGTINLDIPADLPTGDYSMKVTFRNSHYALLESDPMTVSFHVNLPETYTMPLFDNVIAVVNTCECLSDVQWYHRENSTAAWQAISGATGYYYRQVGGLTGEYFISTKMNGVATYTCPQTDMKTLYGAKKSVAQVRVTPNPVQSVAEVTVEGSEKTEHSLRIVSMTGSDVVKLTFVGNRTTVDMSGYPIGGYMVSVDGVVVKVIRK
ncbi:MAG: InlB B-repeat-containing protein [Bacteroidales bacterium]|nr:InlB B-repeat-containing protein [Bacteroidales bacterium]